MRHIWKLIWLFAFASMFGFLLESLESLLSTGQVQNRQGLLFGPFTPVYGGGAVVLALLAPLTKHLSGPRLFFAAVLTGTAVEYVWSAAQEGLFGVVFWNYSHLPLQLHGRVNLLFSLFWGILGVLFWKKIWPWWSGLYDALPRSNTQWIGLFLAVLFSSTALWSSAALIRYRQRQQALPALSPLAVYLDRRWDDSTLRAQFPTMRFPTSPSNA